MIDLSYSLVIEATEDPAFFAFYSPDLEGFTGVGHSIEKKIAYTRLSGASKNISQCFKNRVFPSRHIIPTLPS